MDIKAIKGSLTLRNDVINAYLKEINTFPILTPNEEAELIDKIKCGDEKAKEYLINCHQRFVFAIAKRYASDETVMDLVNEGNIGLITALEKYDNTRGIRFLSYAVWYIRRSIHYYLTNDSVLVKKTNNMKIGNRVNKIKNRFYCENGRFPTSSEIVEQMKKDYDVDIQDESEVFDVTADSINNYFDEDKNTIENMSVFTEKTSTDNEFETVADNNYNSILVNNLLGCLNERDKKIIRMAFGIGYDKEYTNYDISLELGMTPERVRQIKNHVINKMKLAMNSVAKYV